MSERLEKRRELAVPMAKALLKWLKAVTWDKATVQAARVRCRAGHPSPISGREGAMSMELLSATPNAYARKAHIALAEKGLAFELVTEMSWDREATAPRYNSSAQT